MKYDFSMILRNKRRAMLTAAVSLSLLGFVPTTPKATAQQKDDNRRTVTAQPPIADDFKIIEAAAEDLQTVSIYPLDSSFKLFAPQVVNVASIYSNVTNFTGQAFSNGGAAVQGTNTITRLVADDLTTTGTAPFNIGGFIFSVSNLNAVAVSARPLVRLYQADGAGGGPGTLITGYNFNSVSVPTNSFRTLSFVANVGVSNTATIWMGINFDNNAGATGATAAQLNLIGQGIFNPPDVGTSADTFFITTAAGSFVANNPAGAQSNFGGNPVGNFGWEVRRATTIQAIALADSNPRQSGGTARWTITLDPAVNVTGVTAANFALATTDTIAGAAITSVTANNFAPQANSYTVTASLGTGTGTVGLNFVSFAGLNTAPTNTLPFAGQVYTVNVVTAATANVEGRVLTANGAGIPNARVQMIDGSGTSRTANTNPFGYYRFREVATGEVCVLNVTHKSYTFASPSQVLQVTGDIQSANFTAQPR